MRYSNSSSFQRSHTRIVFSSTILAVFLSASLAAQDATDPSLILRTAPETTEIPLDPSVPVRIDPVTGDLELTPIDTSLQCSSDGVGGSCDDVRVEILDFQPATAIDAFTSQTIELSWATRGAWECRGAGAGLEATGWTTTEFNLLPSRSDLDPYELDLSAVDLQGADSRTFDLTLECRNGAKEAVPATRQLTVRSITAGSCDGRNPPPSLTQDLQLLRDDNTTTQTWESVFGAQFPAGTTQTKDARIENGQYASLSLDTVDVALGTPGTFVFNDTTTASDADVGPVVWSVSQCPGDFGPGVAESCRGVANPGGIPSNFRWQVGGTSFSRCVMEPDAQYFINLVPARVLPDGQEVDWDCAGSSSITACEFLFRQLPE
ncbi:MAG: hypothetical protein ACQET0_10635 [Pseudomonadota bacterium]